MSFWNRAPKPKRHFTRFVWAPKTDITAYELALCMKAFVPQMRLGSDFANNAEFIRSLPEEAQRHFAVMDFFEG